MNKIMLFAHLRDEAGAEYIEIQAEGKTVSEVKVLIAEKYNLTKLDSTMSAINEEFAEDDEVIQKGDIIAFIPPVSGG